MYLPILGVYISIYSMHTCLTYIIAMCDNTYTLNIQDAYSGSRRGDNSYGDFTIIHQLNFEERKKNKKTSMCKKKYLARGVTFKGCDF